MKNIASLGLLILVASMALGGMTSNVSAQDDSSVLLKIAKRAQEKQIHNQISADSSDQVKRLFEEGTQKVNTLERALRSDDAGSVKENFLSAMKIFKEISRHLNNI